MSPSSLKRREDIYRIRSNYVFLHKVCSPDITNHLYQGNILDEDTHERVELPSVSTTDCIKLSVDALIKKIDRQAEDDPVDYYDVFVNCLNAVNQGFVAIRLAETPIPDVLPVEAISGTGAASTTATTTPPHGKQQSLLDAEVRFSDPKVIDSFVRVLSHEVTTVEEKVRRLRRNRRDTEEILKNDTDTTRQYIFYRVECEERAERGEKDVEPPAEEEEEETKKKKRTTSTETDRIAHYLAVDCVNFMSGKPRAYTKHQVDADCAVTLRYCVADIVRGNDNKLAAYIAKLRTEVNGFETLFNVANYVFGFVDEANKTSSPPSSSSAAATAAAAAANAKVTINWGRIVALYAFGGYLAMYGRVCKDRNVENIISDYLGFYVSTKLGVWIDDKGGWVSYDQLRRYWQVVICASLY